MILFSLGDRDTSQGLLSVYVADNIGAVVELKSETEEFTKPDWIGEEVTHDQRYYNSNLSTHPYKRW